MRYQIVISGSGCFGGLGYTFREPKVYENKKEAEAALRKVRASLPKSELAWLTEDIKPSDGRKENRP